MNKTAMITGATSGIGAAFARKFASLGYDLLLLGRREKELSSLCNEIAREYSVNALYEILELSDSTEVDSFVEKHRNISLDALINNAGYGNRKSFFEDTLDNQMKMLEVHNRSVLKLMYAFKPALDRSDSGMLINVSSLMGFYALPGTSMYSATKSFLILFTKALAYENKNKKLKFQVLCPGLTRTDFHRKAPLSDKNMKNRGIIRWMTPDGVVERSLKDIKWGRIVSIPGFWNRLTTSLLKILPEFFYSWLARKVV